MHYFSRFRELLLQRARALQAHVPTRHFTSPARTLCVSNIVCTPSPGGSSDLRATPLSLSCHCICRIIYREPRPWALSNQQVDRGSSLYVVDGSALQSRPLQLQVTSVQVPQSFHRTKKARNAPPDLSHQGRRPAHATKSFRTRHKSAAQDASDLRQSRSLYVHFLNCC